MRADAHGAETNLHVRQNLAFQPVHGDHRDRKPGEDQQNVEQSPKNTSGDGASFAGRPFSTGQVSLNAIENALEHQRSTSPSTMSSVPITAMTSATSAPRTIKSKACKFTHDGGRTRM